MPPLLNEIINCDQCFLEVCIIVLGGIMQMLCASRGRPESTPERDVERRTCA